MIRDMVLGDIYLVESSLAYRMYEGSAYFGLDYDPNRVRGHLRQSVLSDSCFGCVAEVGGELVGFLTGYVTPYVFGNELLASEQLWYVLPGSRSLAHGSGLMASAGLGLLRAFEVWARGKGVREVAVGLSTGNDPDRVGALLERRGYRHMGGAYKLPVVG
jgi:hypothetical protein